MDKQIILEKLKNGLIVSCQALEDEPMYGSEIMSRMARAAEIGGAVAIRANTVEDILEIKKSVKLPIIGIIKREYEGYEPYITPTMKEVYELAATQVDIIAVDATKSPRPGNISAAEFIKCIKESFDTIVMADISTYEEGLAAEEAGADIISTTLSGYTSYSLQSSEPDFELIQRLSGVARVPVIAEGRIETPEQAKKCLNEGAYAIVVGGAITRPHLITKRYKDILQEGA